MIHTNNINIHYLQVLSEAVQKEQTFVQLNQFRANVFSFFKKVNQHKIFFNLSNQMIETSANINNIGNTFLLFEISIEDLKNELTMKEFDQYIIEKIKLFIKNEMAFYLRDNDKNIRYYHLTNDFCFEQLPKDMYSLINSAIINGNMEKVNQLFLNSNGQLNEHYIHFWNTSIYYHLSLKNFSRYCFEIYNDILTKTIKVKIVLNLFDNLAIFIQENKHENLDHYVQYIYTVMDVYHITNNDLLSYNNQYFKINFDHKKTLNDHGFSI